MSNDQPPQGREGRELKPMKLATRVIIKAQELISSPDRWQQGSDETFISETSDEAKHCLLGALEAAGKAFAPRSIEGNPVLDEAVESVSRFIQCLPKTETKLRPFLEAEGRADADPEARDWINSYNDHAEASHQQIITLLGILIAASEHCSDCGESIVPWPSPGEPNPKGVTCYVVRFENEPKWVLCDDCGGQMPCDDYDSQMP